MADAAAGRFRSDQADLAPPCPELDTCRAEILEIAALHMEVSQRALGDRCRFLRSL